MTDEPESVGDVLDRVEELANKEGQVCLGHLVEALGGRSYGPFLLKPALIDISPIGGIPGLPTFLGLVIIIVAAQILFGRKHLWLPSFLARRSISAEKACKSTAKLRRLAGWLDRTFHGRMPKFTKGPFVRVAAVFCILLALTVPPLEILPFATTAPMAAIGAFGLALLVRDGLLMIIATILAVAAVGLGIGLFGSKIAGGGQ